MKPVPPVRSFVVIVAAMVIMAGWPADAMAAGASKPEPIPSVAGVWWSLPFMLMLSIGLHALIGRSLKAIIAASRPLASGEPEVGGYQRSVYGTADPAMRNITLAVLAAGVLFWLEAWLGVGWLGWLGTAVLCAALGFDLRHWERVTVGPDNLWFQRGLGQKVHQVSIDNIRDLSVTEVEAPGFTLRHGTHNSLCRLSLRLNDKRIVALPKTDTACGLDAVETVANHVRNRKQLVADRPRRRSDPPSFDAPDTVPASRIRPTGHPV